MADELSVKLKRIRSRIDRGEKAYQILKDAVIHRQFVPGVWIKQEQVSQAIGISRTPVRQALARLQSEGLIETKPRRGFRVVEFSQDELDDLFEVREILETSLFIRSSKDIPFDELKEIQARLREAEQGMKEADSDPDLWDQRLRKWLIVDRSFHDRLIEASGNEQWVQIYLNIRDKIDIIGYQASYIPEQLAKAIGEHYRIIEALMDNRFAEAGQIMQEHIKNVWGSIKLTEPHQADKES
jgi:DNA-binding GntR family transcriptional regulator